MNIVPEKIFKSQSVRVSLRVCTPSSERAYSSYGDGVSASTAFKSSRISEMRVIALSANSKSPAEGVDTENCTVATID